MYLLNYILAKTLVSIMCSQTLSDLCLRAASVISDKMERKRNTLQIPWRCFPRKWEEQDGTTSERIFLSYLNWFGFKWPLKSRFGRWGRAWFLKELLRPYWSKYWSLSLMPQAGWMQSWQSCAVWIAIRVVTFHRWLQHLHWMSKHTVD